MVTTKFFLFSKVYLFHQIDSTTSKNNHWKTSNQLCGTLHLYFLSEHGHIIAAINPVNVKLLSCKVYGQIYCDNFYIKLLFKRMQNDLITEELTITSFYFLKILFVFLTMTLESSHWKT